MSCRLRYIIWQFHTRWRSIITTMHWLSWTLHLIIFLVFKHQFVSAPIFRADISLTAISDSRNFYFYFLLVWLLCDQLCFGYFSLYPNAYCNRDVLSYYPIQCTVSKPWLSLMNYRIFSFDYELVKTVQFYSAIFRLFSLQLLQNYGTHNFCCTHSLYYLYSFIR